MSFYCDLFSRAIIDGLQQELAASGADIGEALEAPAEEIPTEAAVENVCGGSRGARAEAAPETEVAPEAETKAEAEVAPEAETKAEAEVAPETETKAEVEAKAESQEQPAEARAEDASTPNPA